MREYSPSHPSWSIFRSCFALTTLINRNHILAICQALVHSDAGDVIQNVLLYLNSPSGPSDMTDGSGERLTDLMVGFLQNVQEHAREIAAE